MAAHGHRRSGFPAFLMISLISTCGAAGRLDSRPTNTTDHFPMPSHPSPSFEKLVVDEAHFRAIIRQVIDPYQELAARHGARIVIRIPVEARVSPGCAQANDEDTILRCSWQSDFTNADAGRSRHDSNWRVGVGGGLARLPTMTEEGLTLVLCHELGHLFGGFPFVREGFTGLALPISVDGQADYFAAQVCARKIWAHEDNAQNQEGVLYRTLIEKTAVEQCDAIHNASRERNLCYKTVFAGVSFVKSMRPEDSQDPVPSVDTPDSEEVGSTNSMHPPLQCRLDTFFAGALCPTVLQPTKDPSVISYDESIIPGFDIMPPGGQEARSQSMAVSCREDFFPKGARPRCWFSPEQIENGGWMNNLNKIVH